MLRCNKNFVQCTKFLVRRLQFSTQSSRRFANSLQSLANSPFLTPPWQTAFDPGQRHEATAAVIANRSGAIIRAAFLFARCICVGSHRPAHSLDECRRACSFGAGRFGRLGEASAAALRRFSSERLGCSTGGDGAVGPPRTAGAAHQLATLDACKRTRRPNRTGAGRGASWPVPDCAEGGRAPGEASQWAVRPPH